jgi:urease accessory protein
MTLPFAAISRSESPARLGPERLQRAEGQARLALQAQGGGTRLERLFQSGSAKVRMPRALPGEPWQAVLINTAGGLTGGDQLGADISVGKGARAIVTSQACEKIYRSAAGFADVHNTVEVGEGARLDWLPQETILFDGARLSRRVDVELHRDATLLMLEATIFGRAACGEHVRTGLFRDRWRIRRDGRLVFADDMRFDWADDELLGRPAVLHGGSAVATILYVAGEPELHLERVRELIGWAGGASAWSGKLLARVVAEGGAALRWVLTPVLMDLLDGAALPKIWLN